MSIDWIRDEIILACDLVSRNSWRGYGRSAPEVQGLSELLNKSPIHPQSERDPKFRNPNGVARKTWDIATQHPDYEGKRTKGNKLDAEVLRLFLSDENHWRAVAESIRAEILEGSKSAPPVSIDAEDSAEEGRLLLARHYRRERDPGLRHRKIEDHKRSGLPVACEVCGFDFLSIYGERGRDFIEVHHVLPLHVTGPTRTRLQDLALLCSNCHRMIHRRRWLMPVELKELLRN